MNATVFATVFVTVFVKATVLVWKILLAITHLGGHVPTFCDTSAASEQHKRICTLIVSVTFSRSPLTGKPFT